MLYKESGGLIDWFGPDPKEEGGAKIVVDCGGGTVVSYSPDEMDEFTARVCGCYSILGAVWMDSSGEECAKYSAGCKLYGMYGKWGCPESWGGTGNPWTAHPAEPWTTTPPDLLDDIDAMFDDPPAEGSQEPPAEGSPKPKKPPGPIAPPPVAIVPAPAVPAGIPWWIWALVAAGGAWFLLRKRGR